MNPVALVTGASRGLGRGIVHELARIGYDLVLNFIKNEGAAEATAGECEAIAQDAGHSVRTVLCRADVARREDRERLIETTQQRFGRLDLLVNNAGVAPEKRVDLLEADEASFDRLMSTNVKGPYFLTQLAATWMVRQAQSQTSQSHAYKPKIVTITSISAYTASVTRGDYCLAKAALAMLTPLYATRLAADGISVFEVRPGIMATDMTAPVKERYDTLIRDGLTPIRRWGTPEDVGKAVAAIALGHFPFSTGEVINVDGGFHLRTL